MEVHVGIPDVFESGRIFLFFHFCMGDGYKMRPKVALGEWLPFIFKYIAKEQHYQNRSNDNLNHFSFSRR